MNINLTTEVQQTTDFFINSEGAWLLNKTKQHQMWSVTQVFFIYIFILFVHFFIENTVIIYLFSIQTLSF